MEQGVERAKREKVGPGEEREEILAVRMEQERMQHAGGEEPDPEAAVKCPSRRGAGGGPVGSAARVGEQRIERGLGALQGDGHPVAGKWRNEAVGVT